MGKTPRSISTAIRAFGGLHSARMAWILAAVLKKRIPVKLRKALIICSIIAMVCLLVGCNTLDFYAQAAKGQWRLLSARESISHLEALTNTPPELKDRFRVLAEIRDFAEKELALPVDGHYLSYADLKRPYVVWNVEAAPELSMTPKKWWYPVVGKLKYRGYFSNAGATNYAEGLTSRGYDTYVGGVQAYSTLGLFKDIALNTFLFDTDPYLAELIFHELSHQEVFASGDTDFNEAFATTVGEEGTRRWLRAHRDPAMLASYERDVARNREFVELIARTRQKLETLFGDVRDEDGELRATPMEGRDEALLRAEKARIYADLLAEYGALKESWGGATTYDRWFSRQLNNAKLNSVAAYYDLVPGFQALLELEGGDLKKFYGAAERLAKMPKKERRRWLEVLETSATQTNAMQTNVSSVVGIDGG